MYPTGGVVPEPNFFAKSAATPPPTPNNIFQFISPFAFVTPGIFLNAATALLPNLDSAAFLVTASDFPGVPLVAAVEATGLPLLSTVRVLPSS